jgi:glycosyltransferase involved in cell wall biosynthesis/peptidoglycan/xylan/chitin deacetylase (PgdA/CDA1 family)
MMKFSVCIATYNRKDSLQRTLQSLFTQDFPLDQFEIVIVDDGSTDGTAEFLRTLQAPCTRQVLHQPNRGQAAAQNAAIRAAQGDLILLLDDDILCERDLLRQHVESHSEGKASLVFGSILVAEESPDTLAAEWTRVSTAQAMSRLESNRPTWPFDAITDANCSIPRASLLACGGLDESFHAGSNARSNADLGLRLWKHGVHFCYAPSAVVRQIYFKSSEQLVRDDAKWYGRNEVLLSRKHPQYRPHSPLASLGKGSFAKRFLRTASATSPISPDLFLRGPYWFLERLRSIPGARRAGVRLLQTRMALSGYRSIAREFGPWDALLGEFGRRLPVLLYHHVGPGRQDTYPELTVSPGKFERQMDWLARHGYVCIRPADWLAWCREGKSLPPKPVLLTFDDAYADLIEYAFPVLRRHGFGAAVYVVTGQIGGTNVWDQAAGSGVHHLMNAEQIREWAQHGIEFGAHTRSHPDLTQLSGDALAAEIRGSREDLERILEHPPSSFVYPFGYQNDCVRAAVEQYFDLAFTVEEGLNDLSTNLFELRRTMVRPDDSIQRFSSRVRFGWPPLLHVRSRLRIRSRVKQAWRSLRFAHS